MKNTKETTKVSRARVPTFSILLLLLFSLLLGACSTEPSKVLERELSPTAEQPLLEVSPASGLQDTPIPLAIHVEPADSRARVQVVISDVPEGARLSAGQQIERGRYSLDLKELRGLTITPPRGSTEGFELVINAVTEGTEANQGQLQPLAPGGEPCIKATPCRNVPVKVYSLTQLTASNGASGDQFGYTVAIDGNTVVVGAPYDKVGRNTSQGSVYIYKKQLLALPSGVLIYYWKLQEQLTASDGKTGDRFGHAVAIDGNRVIVGAPYADPYSSSNRGKAYIFTLGSSTQEQILDGLGGTNSHFGWAVDIDGNTVVVGAENAGFAGKGGAYIFTWSSVSSKFSYAQALAGQGGHFGISVAIDSGTIVVGAHRYVGSQNFEGRAYVFSKSGSSWSQQAELKANDAALYDAFGWSVAISGNKIVVGAPYFFGNSSKSGKAYVFMKDGSSWLQQQKLSKGSGGDRFGYSVDIDDKIIVGAPYHDVGGTHRGAIYIFKEHQIFALSLETKLGTGQANDLFGSAVATQGGNYVVGAPGASNKQGKTYIIK